MQVIGQRLFSVSYTKSSFVPVFKRSVHSFRRQGNLQELSAKRNRGSQENLGGKGLFVTIDPDGADAWRLDAVVNLIKEGAVGILPTDTFPAVVCDLENRQAVKKLYSIQRLPPKKPLSILVRDFRDVSTYTLGFPAANIPGQLDGFHLAKRVLPGPYTFILSASKALPKQCIDYASGKTKSRKTVGVRMPADPNLQALLNQLERPLLCNSVHTEEDVVEGNVVELPDPAVMYDIYVARGIDFMVTTGQTLFVEGSTVVDMTSGMPEVLREGSGDASLFRQPEFA